MVRDDIGPEPERYYDWMLWKLRKSEKWREMKEYSKNKRIQSTQEKMYKLNDPIWDKRWTRTYSEQMQEELEPIESDNDDEVHTQEFKSTRDKSKNN